MSAKTICSTELGALASSMDVPQEGDYFMLWFALLFRQRARREKVIEEFENEAHTDIDSRQFLINFLCFPLSAFVLFLLKARGIWTMFFMFKYYALVSYQRSTSYKVISY